MINCTNYSNKGNYFSSNKHLASRSLISVSKILEFVNCNISFEKNVSELFILLELEFLCVSGPVYYEFIALKKQ